MSSCLVVEDSRLARNELVNILESLNHFSNIHQAKDAEEAKAFLEAEEPDVVFLDIHLPGMNGFELLESLDQVPPVIFTTAYDEYAIKSFEFNAIDYLLKPIKKDRLIQAIAKLQTKTEPVKKKTTMDQQVFLRDGEKCWFVKLTEIRFFESVGNYCKVYFQDNRPLIQKSLNYLEEVLDESKFLRVNRKQIINLSFIEKIDPWFNGKLKITLTSGEEIEVSRRQSQRIKNMFSL